MFRIERNLVNLSDKRVIKAQNDVNDVETAIDEPVAVSGYTNVNPNLLVEEAKKRAKDIIENAHKEAANIISAGNNEAEEIKREAWDAGYLSGESEGKMSYDAKTAECEEGLKTVLRELYNERERIYAGMESELTDLALQVVRKIINPSEEAVGGVFDSLIRNALRQIAPDNKVILRVSANDYERFFSEGSCVFDLGNGITVSASILKDVSLGDYDCIIDSNDSTVNAGLDTQLKHIQLAFRKKQ